MARKVTAEDIKQFNELYQKYKTYAEVARQTGWSASTVSKYIDKNYVMPTAAILVHFDMTTMPEFSPEMFKGIENYGELCELSDEEKEGVVALWKELLL